MNFTSGFFNASNHDRLYPALEYMSIFDGLVKDGVFRTVGNAFDIKAYKGMILHIYSGRALFDHVWCYNDTIFPMTVDISEIILDRIDALVFEINHTLDVREGMLKWVKGTPSSTPVKPTLTKTDEITQYPLCYVTVKAETSVIEAMDIESVIGTDECPWASGIFDTHIKTDKLAQYFYAKFNLWFRKSSAAAREGWGSFKIDAQNEFEAWFTSLVVPTLSTAETDQINENLNWLRRNMGPNMYKPDTEYKYPTCNYGTLAGTTTTIVDGYNYDGYDIFYLDLIDNRVKTTNASASDLSRLDDPPPPAELPDCKYVNFKVLGGNKARLVLSRVKSEEAQHRSYNYCIPVYPGRYIEEIVEETGVLAEDIYSKRSPISESKIIPFATLNDPENTLDWIVGDDVGLWSAHYFWSLNIGYLTNRPKFTQQATIVFATEDATPFMSPSAGYAISVADFNKIFIFSPDLGDIRPGSIVIFHPFKPASLALANSIKNSLDDAEDRLGGYRFGLDSEGNPGYYPPGSAEFHYM